MSFWFCNLAGSAVLIQPGSPPGSDSDSHCSELIEFGDSAEIHTGAGSGSLHPPPAQQQQQQQQEQERLCHDSHFILLDDSTAGRSTNHLDLNSPSPRTNAYTQHGIMPHHCSPAALPMPHRQSLGSNSQSSGLSETSGPAAQQLLQNTDSRKHRAASPPTSKHGIQVARMQQHDSSIIWKPRRQGQGPTPLSTTPAAQAHGVLNRRQPSSKKRLLDSKILELQLKGERAAMSEKMIREELGNNPDTSKALRRLTQEGKLLRTGKGGRSSPFSYIATQEAKQALEQIRGEEMQACG